MVKHRFIFKNIVHSIARNLVRGSLHVVPFQRGNCESAQRLADVRLCIPMDGMVDSVNVATACAIALHALAATPAVAERARDRRQRHYMIYALGAASALVAGVLLRHRLGR